MRRLGYQDKSHRERELRSGDHTAYLGPTGEVSRGNGTDGPHSMVILILNPINQNIQ